MGRVKTWKGGYNIYQNKQRIVDNISGYHFSRTCWSCNEVDKCKCNPAFVKYYKPIWYVCLACKIKRGELDSNGHPLR